MRAIGTLLVLVTFLTGAVAHGAPPAYGDADLLALEISGALLAPGTLVSQVSTDLNAIRSAFPVVTDIHARASWLPGVIMTRLSAQAWADYQAGVFNDFNTLNAQYGPVVITPVSLNTLKLEFEALYHPVVLASAYAQVPGILWAEPVYLFGDGDDITAQQAGTYLFKNGWEGCSAGCIHAHFWQFAVTGGNAVLISEYGDPTTGVGDTPGAAGTSIVTNVPNPFSGSTVIRYKLGSPGTVRLRIHDVSGRLIRELKTGFLPAGAYSASWDADDETGRRVASGVYFCSLVTNGVAHTRKLLVTR